VGKGALVAIFAFSIHHKVFAHFSAEFVNVWSRWGEVVIEGQ